MFASFESLFLISVIAFITVILTIEGGYLLWKSIDVPSVIRVNKRLKELSASGIEHKEAVSILRQRQFSEIEILHKLLFAIPRFHGLDNLLEQAGMGLSVSRLMGIQLLLSAMLFLFFYTGLHWFFPLALIIGFVLGISAPYLVVVQKRNKRRTLFAEQLPDTLDFISRSLRAGNPFMVTIKSVAENMPEPSASEFGITFNELNYGSEINEALHHLGERTGSEDIRFFITAVIIQRSTGGNLAEILNRISAVMRARANTYREIGILATEMKYSANVLIALPFIVAIAISIIQPGYLDVLFKTEVGLLLVGLQLTLMGIGYWIVQKMINFRV